MRKLFARLHRHVHEWVLAGAHAPAMYVCRRCGVVGNFDEARGPYETR